MADLSQILMPYLPFEKTQKKMGIKNPILKSLLNPMTIAGMLAGGAGLGMAMAKRGGKNIAKGMLGEAEEAAAKKLLRPGFGSTLEGGPVFHSRLSRALRKINPNTRIKSYGDLLKAAEKGGGASRGEATLLTRAMTDEKTRDVGSLILDAPPVVGQPEFGSWWKNPSSVVDDELIGSGKMRASELADFLDDNPVMPLQEGKTIPRAESAPSGGPRGKPLYGINNPSGGSNYEEMALFPSTPRNAVRGATGLTTTFNDAPNVSTSAGAHNEVYATATGGFQKNYMSHINADDVNPLVFALTKQREFEGVGNVLSAEQVQTGLPQPSKISSRIYNSPDVFKAINKRYPDIMMARLARKAADEGLEGVTWHPGDIVRSATYGQKSGQDAWYGVGVEPRGRLYDAARKLQKQIPGSTLEVQTLSGTSVPFDPERVPDNVKTLTKNINVIDDQVRYMVSLGPVNQEWDDNILSLFRNVADNMAPTEEADTIHSAISKLSNLMSARQKYNASSIPPYEFLIKASSPNFKRPRFIGENIWSSHGDRSPTYFSGVDIGQALKKIGSPEDVEIVGHAGRLGEIIDRFVYMESTEGFQEDGMSRYMADAIKQSRASADTGRTTIRIPSATPRNDREAYALIKDHYEMAIDQVKHSFQKYPQLANAAFKEEQKRLAMDKELLRAYKDFHGLISIQTVEGDEMVRDTVLEGMNRLVPPKRVEEDKRWLLRLPPESREAIKKMTFPLLGAAGVMVPMSVGGEG